MSVYDEKLWEIMERKAEQEGETSRRNDWHEYVAGVRKVCDFGIDRAKLIRETFPLYTLHDETHICNVLRLMNDLLGSRAKDLTRDEAALLVMCACCHDVGMSYSDEEKRELLQDRGKIDAYLDSHPDEYVQAYKKNPDWPVLDDEMQRSYFRSIHHERVSNLLYTIEWPRALVGRVNRDAVVRVCESHGNSVASLNNLEPTYTIDPRMCAVLLRLADILDFDDSRTPKAIYDYCGFAGRTDEESKKSAEEWEKHRSSARFNFPSTAERKHGYELEYHASCDNPQVEQGVSGYLDWVDNELRECDGVRDRFRKRWRRLVLPRKVDRKIERIGYESGEFRLTLDHDKVLDLLVGNNLYTDQSVFVRELIQNAIDAVRTRQELDDPRHPWEPRIDIRTWTDNEGYHWFSIKDNGVGMTKDTMLKHLLKVGNSYYTSDDFQWEKLRHNASPDYTPISRFGIGILSCFMGDDGAALVEISTKHYEKPYSPLRLRIDGTSGFYHLCNKDKGHCPDPDPMQEVAGSDGHGYLLEPGTIVVVRTNLYAIGVYDGFKKIVDKYVAFPPVPIHYEGDEGTFYYPTEQELVAGACGMESGGIGHGGGAAANVVDLPIPAGAVEQIQRVWPEFSWSQDVRVQLGRLPLGAYAATKHVSGAAVVARTVGDFPTFTHRFGTQEIEMRARADLEPMTLIAEGERSIRLRVLVRPKGMDEYDVNSIISRYKRFVYPDSGSSDVVHEYEKQDPCLASILEALRKPDTLDTVWRAAMRGRYSLTEEELSRQVERARGIVCQLTGLEPNQIDFARCLSQTREWRFTVCDLTSLDWYNTWFGDTHARTGHRMLVAHNGISCGSAENLFCDKDNGSHCVAAILLLKDKYRPDLGLARDGIRGYTLETQLVLELMRRRIQAEGYYLGEDYPTHSANYHLLAVAAYENVLASNKALAHELTLVVDDGEQVGIDELVGTRKTYELARDSAPILMWDDRSGVLAQRYQRFCLARAQQVFTIKAHFGGSSSIWESYVVRLFPKEEHDLPQGYQLFPPTFFALPLSQEDTRLTTRHYGARHCINAEHPLARFLLQNAKTLHNSTPSIFAEFTRCLAEDDADDLVRTVNTLIERLHTLHNSPLDVPADLTLTDTDLC